MRFFEQKSDKIFAKTSKKLVKNKQKTCQKQVKFLLKNERKPTKIMSKTAQNRQVFEPKNKKYKYETKVNT